MAGAGGGGCEAQQEQKRQQAAVMGQDWVGLRAWGAPSPRMAAASARSNQAINRLCPRGSRWRLSVQA